MKHASEKLHVSALQGIPSSFWRNLHAFCVDVARSWIPITMGVFWRWLIRSKMVSGKRVGFIPTARIELPCVVLIGLMPMQTNTCTCTILLPRSYMLVWWPYYESLLPMAMVGDHNTPPHDSSRPDAVESHHPCIVHGVMRPWLFHLAWIGRRLHPCYSHRLIRLVLKKIFNWVGWIEWFNSIDSEQCFVCACSELLSQALCWTEL